jgi:anti-anti-sigma factor
MAQFRITELPGGSAQAIELVLPVQSDPTDFDTLNETLLKRLDTDPNTRWLLDLSEVKYVGSILLGLLVNIRDRVNRRGGRLVVAAVPNDLMKVIVVTSMQRLFQIYPTKAEGLRALGAK